MSTRSTQLTPFRAAGLILVMVMLLLFAAASPAQAAPAAQPIGTDAFQMSSGNNSQIFSASGLADKRLDRLEILFANQTAGTGGLVPGLQAIRQESTPAQTGTITIVKDADPPDGTDFDFTLFAASTATTTPFTLDDADPDDGDPITDTVSFTLPSGDYQVTELLSNGWALQFIQCEYDGSTVGIIYGENRAYIDLAAGDDVICTFNNHVQTPTAVTLVGLEAVADRAAPWWPWLLALIGAALGAAVVVWRRRSMAS